MNRVISASLCLIGLSCAVLAFADKPEQIQLQQQADATLKQNVSDEMHQITKSLEDLLGELSQIKREATGRLSNVKNRASTTDQERIRQTKVSRFVLTRVSELESESLSMRDELAKLFSIQKLSGSPNKQAASIYRSSEAKQEDIDFDEPPATTTTQSSPNSSSSEGMPRTTTLKPDDEEAAKLGFDMEALKKLGEEIGKRLDQFGKDAAKNLSDLVEGVKLVFREPNSKNRANSTRPNSGSMLSKIKIVYDVATITPPKP